MIVYHNRDARFILFRKTGSVLLSPGVLGPAFMSSCLCVALLFTTDERPQIKLSTAVARIYATILGFVIVFRTRMAFGRFNEGISQVQMMFSKWRDAFNSLAAFIQRSSAHQVKTGNTEAVTKLLLAKARLLHWFTLLAALAVQELQMAADPEQLDDEDGDEGVSRLCVQGSPVKRFSDEAAGGYKPPRKSVGMAHALNFHSSHSDDDEDVRFVKSQRQRRPSVRPSICAQLSNRSVGSHALGRSFHSSRPSSFETVSVHASLVPDEQKRCAVYVVGEITPEELDQIYGSHDHVLTVIKWILLEVSMLSTSGSLLIAPPILSRVYQALSNGMLAFSMARMKISVVPFPFPFAQVLCYSLYAFYMVCPLVVLEIMEDEATQLDQIAIPVLLNFAACVGYAAVNEIAVELEMPFGFDSNDYPAHGQQNLIVKTMEDTYFVHAPTDFSLNAFAGENELVQFGHMQSDVSWGEEASFSATPSIIKQEEAEARRPAVIKEEESDACKATIIKEDESDACIDFPEEVCSSYPLPRVFPKVTPGPPDKCLVPPLTTYKTACLEL